MLEEFTNPLNLKIMKTKNVSNLTSPSSLSKSMKEILFNGEIMTSITDQNTKIGMWAKVTEMDINGMHYYGMWEKEYIFGDWRLLHFGRQPEVEPLWQKYLSSIKKSMKLVRMEAA